MANAVQTSFTHTYNGAEFITELFFKPQEGSDDIFGGRYKVMQVADKKNLYIPGNLSKILKEYSACGFSASGNLTISDRVISTEKVKVNLDTKDFERKIDKLLKSIQSLANSKIIVSIEKRSITKRWYEFWK